MKAKVLTLLGFASKSGNLSFGFSASTQAINRNKAGLIIVACDVSQKSLKEITFHAEKKSVEILILKDISIFELSNSVGHKCGIISVNEDGFKRAIKEEILNDQ